MALNPSGFSNISFRPATENGRGYHKEEVDEFVRVADAEVRRLLSDRAALEETLQRQGHGGGTPQQTMADLAELTATLERMKAGRALAEQHLGNLRKQLAQLDTVPSTHETFMARVVALAQQTADGYLHDAEHEAQHLLTKARTKAQQIENEAALQAATIDGDARHRYHEDLNGLADRRAAALADIVRLTESARDYYFLLGDNLAGRLGRLDDHDDAVLRGLPRHDR